MQQVTVPQFLDVEDKVIGPITIRQFIELMVGAGIIFIFYKIFDFSLFLASGLVVTGITLIIAFAKVNGQVFHLFLLNVIATLKNPKLKVWRKKISMEELRLEMKKPSELGIAPKTVSVRPVSASKLSELSLIVDTGGVYTGEQ